MFNNNNSNDNSQNFSYPSVSSPKNPNPQDPFAQQQPNSGFNFQPPQQQQQPQQLYQQYIPQNQCSPQMMQQLLQQQLLQQQYEQQMRQSYNNSGYGNSMFQSFGPMDQSQSFMQKPSLLQSFQTQSFMQNVVPKTIHIKCKFNGECRRFKVDASIKLEDLLEEVKKFFNVSFKFKEITMKYLDQDKDSVEINNEKDYIEAREIAYTDREYLFRISIDFKDENILKEFGKIKIEEQKQYQPQPQQKPQPQQQKPVEIQQTRDWTTELQFLQEMGFANKQKNIQLLEQHKGDITSVVQILVSNN
eukprot:gene3807-6968_t